MTKPDFGQRETELKRALVGNRSLLVLLFAGLVIVTAFVFTPCALSKPGATRIASQSGPSYSAELIIAGFPG